MNAKQRNTLLAVGIVSGLLSLPLTWMSIHNAQFGGAFGQAFAFGAMFQAMTIDVNALNGSVTLLITVPVWLVVCGAMAANVLQIMKSSSMFAIPTIALWLVALLAAVWVVVPFVPVLASGKATLGIGWFFGVFCAVTPLICLTLAGISQSSPGD